METYEYAERAMQDYPDYFNAVLEFERHKIADMKFLASLAMLRVERLYYDQDMTEERREKLDLIWEILRHIAYKD